MSPVNGYDDGLVSGFPRVSGDEPRFTQSWPRSFVFSPRERG